MSNQTATYQRCWKAKLETVTIARSIILFHLSATERGYLALHETVVIDC